MRRLVVPWAVFPPICRRDFLPRVVERLLIRKDLHFDRVLRAGLVNARGRCSGYRQTALRVAFVPVVSLII